MLLTGRHAPRPRGGRGNASCSSGVVAGGPGRGPQTGAAGAEKLGLKVGDDVAYESSAKA